MPINLTKTSEQLYNSLFRNNQKLRRQMLNSSSAINPVNDYERLKGLFVNKEGNLREVNVAIAGVGGVLGIAGIANIFD